MAKKVYTGWTKLDSSNYDAEKNIYTAEVAYQDGEKVKFTFDPTPGISSGGVEYIGRVQIEGAERPTNIKEKQNDKGVFIYGCVNFDEDKRCNMRKGQSLDSVQTWTISFSKPEIEEEHPFEAIEAESDIKDDKKEDKKVEDKKDDDLPF